MNLIVQLIVGGIIGWLASIVMKTNAQMGLIANIIVGIIGAVIGGYLATALNMGASGIVSVLFSIIGACVLIFLLKAGRLQVAERRGSSRGSVNCGAGPPGCPWRPAVTVQAP